MTKLYVIENSEGLIGKIISYVEIVNVFNQTSLITSDGGIIVWKTDSFPDGSIETTIYDRDDTECFLFVNIALQRHILSKGICQEKELDCFLAKQVEKTRKERERRHEIAEERDKREYERLKAKFGG